MVPLQMHQHLNGKYISIYVDSILFHSIFCPFPLNLRDLSQLNMMWDLSYDFDRKLPSLGSFIIFNFPSKMVILYLANPKAIPNTFTQVFARVVALCQMFDFLQCRKHDKNSIFLDHDAEKKLTINHEMATIDINIILMVCDLMSQDVHSHIDTPFISLFHHQYSGYKSLIYKNVFLP